MATGPTTMEGVDQPVHATRPRPRPPRSSPPDSATDADDGSVDDERRPSPADIFLEAAQAIESRGRVSPPELTAIEPTDEDQRMPQATDHTAPPGPERRRVDDLNVRIHEAMTFTGTLTSQQLFELAKPYYDLNPSKSELSQWARARIANLRRKRKVWPTAHMVYGAIKAEGPRDAGAAAATGAGAAAATGRSGMWECKGLRESIDATEFLEAPRTVYWSWDHGLKKHGLTVAVAGGGAVAGTAAAPPAGAGSSGGAGKRVFGFGIEQKVLFKGEPAAPTSDSDEPRDTHFESLADISTSEGQVLSPTSEIRGAMLLTRISSPIGSNRPMSAPAGMASSAQMAAWAMPGSDDDGSDGDGDTDFDCDGDGDGDGSLPASPLSNPEASNRLLMLAMIAKEIQSDGTDADADADGSSGGRAAKKARTAGSRASTDAGFSTRGGGGRRKGPKGPHRGAKYRCGRCGFYPKSCPHDCATGQARPGAEHMVVKAVAEKAAIDAPRYQARPKQYACGKCGFFPKSVMHDCATGAKASSPGGKVGRSPVAAVASAPSETPKRKPPRRESGTPPGRPRQYRCGKCGFFPKSTRHDCITGQPSDASEAAEAAATITATATATATFATAAATAAATAVTIASKNKNATHETKKMPSQNRRRQYKCGKCNFFPKTQPHDCARYQHTTNVADSPSFASPSISPDGDSLSTPSPAPKLDAVFETPEPVIRQRTSLPPTTLAAGVVFPGPVPAVAALPPLLTGRSFPVAAPPPLVAGGEMGAAQL